MKRYEKYKDSGVEWIGDIPEGWEVKRMKYFTQSKKEKSEDGLEELLSVSEHNGVIPRRNIREIDEVFTRAESLVGYLKVKKGELVSNIMLMWKRGLGVSEYDGIVSPAYSVFSFHKSFPKYFHFLFRTNQYIAEFKRNSTGVIESRLRLYDDVFGAIYSHYPPLKEQEQIVAYLDEKTSHIDKLLDISKRKIGLLKEQRASIINQVITKGLNPNAKMKHSGVEWIGDIPEGWGVNKMKYGVKLITEKALTNLNDVKISPENVEPMTGNCFNYYSTYLGEGIKFRKGDVLLNKLRIYLKKIVLVSMDGYSMGEMLVLRCNEKFFNEYFYYQIFHQGLIDLLNSQSNGVKLPRVSSDIILNTLVAFPPLEEQEQIVAYLDEKTSTIDKSISIEERRIGLLKEYRQSIISQVITGKIKVIADE
jgi:type I restriction enzyme, S subunit